METDEIVMLCLVFLFVGLVILVLTIGGKSNNERKQFCEKHDMIYLEVPAHSCANHEGVIYSIDILKQKEPQ